MNYQQFVDSLDANTIEKFRSAIEIGRWDNGDTLSEKQMESALQAVMLWQAKNETPLDNEPFKVDSNGGFRIGKGDKLNDTPAEYKNSFDADLIFRSKG